MSPLLGCQALPKLPQNVGVDVGQRCLADGVRRNVVVENCLVARSGPDPHGLSVVRQPNGPHPVAQSNLTAR
jgi:hypothetical protein